MFCYHVILPAKKKSFIREAAMNYKHSWFDEMIENMVAEQTEPSIAFVDWVLTKLSLLFNETLFFNSFFINNEYSIRIHECRYFSLAGQVKK